MTTHPDFFPHLHTRPLAGWVNDPNGVGFWEGRWHVMYQWNPDRPVHGDIRWGHMSSADLLHWRDEGSALVPRPGGLDETGCWSGVAVVDNTDVALVYTAVPRDVKQAATAVARLNRTGTWEQPTRTAAKHPDHSVWKEVRDPFVVTIEGKRYGILGASRVSTPLFRVAEDQTTRRCAGVVLIYDASDLDHWELLGELVSAETLPSTMQRAGAIWECPQLVRFGERWLLVVSWDDGAKSAASVQEPSPTQGVACFIGDIGLEGGVPRFTALQESEFDSGPDFYAPQLVVHGDRILAWGWAWEGRGSGVNAHPTLPEDAVSWAGTLSFPREVTENNDGAVVCVPARELSQLRGESLRPELVNSRWQIETSVDAFSVTGEVGVAIDVVGEQSGEVRHVCASSDAGPVTVLVDGSIVEVFDRNGSLTMRAYRRPDELWRATSTAQLSGFTLRLPE